jgi:hypothetical protein
MIDRTTTSLIADIKRMASIPNSQSLYSDQDFVDAMNDCQSSTIIPQIMRVREEFFVTHVDIPLVSGTREYSLPERAIGQKVRQIILIDTQGNEVRLPRVEPENSTWHETYMWWPGTKSGYQFVGSKIKLTPNLDNTYTALRVVYFRRPSDLAKVTNAIQVTAIATANNETTLQFTGSLPTGWAIGRVMDVQHADSPFDTLADSVELLAANPTSVTFAESDVAGVSVGDWVCDEGECVIPQYPVELHRILTNYVLIDVLKHLGDTQGAQNAATDLAEQMNNFDTMISNRDEGSPRKIMSRRGLWDTGGI